MGGFLKNKTHPKVCSVETWDEESTSQVPDGASFFETCRYAGSTSHETDPFKKLHAQCMTREITHDAEGPGPATSQLTIQILWQMKKNDRCSARGFLTEISKYLDIFAKLYTLLSTILWHVFINKIDSKCWWLRWNHPQIQGCLKGPMGRKT